MTALQESGPSGTANAEAGLQHLQKLPDLRTVYLHNTTIPVLPKNYIRQLYQPTGQTSN
jgi:hypothetical protein